MHNRYSLPSHTVPKLSQLPGAFVMPTSSDGLRHETLSCEAMDVLPLGHFLSGESISIGGKVAFGVWLVKPSLAEHTSWTSIALGVLGFGMSQPPVIWDATS